MPIGSSERSKVADIRIYIHKIRGYSDLVALSGIDSINKARMFMLGLTDMTNQIETIIDDDSDVYEAHFKDERLVEAKELRKRAKVLEEMADELLSGGDHV